MATFNIVNELSLAEKRALVVELKDAIYIERESNEKDPTLQALGIGGQIYGARADLIILDDCVTLSNLH